VERHFGGMAGGKGPKEDVSVLSQYHGNLRSQNLEHYSRWTPFHAVRRTTANVRMATMNVRGGAVHTCDFLKLVAMELGERGQFVVGDAEPWKYTDPREFFPFPHIRNLEKRVAVMLCHPIPGGGRATEWTRCYVSLSSGPLYKCKAEANITHTARRGKS
jgi:hypothetical protein